VFKPDCSTKTVEKCTPKTENVCKDVVTFVDEPSSRPVCSNVSDEKCENRTEKVCEKVEVPVTVPGYKRDCKPVEKEVCKEESKTVCEKVPKKTCKEVWTKEMTWETSNHCVESKRCKRSFNKCKGDWCHKSYCNTAPKCWPVKRWVSKPVWKTVCDDVWAEECRNVWKPVCDWVWDEECIRTPVAIMKNIVKEVCRDIQTPVCMPFEREECKTEVLTVPFEKVVIVCENVTTDACEQVNIIFIAPFIQGTITVIVFDQYEMTFLMRLLSFFSLCY
jgi:hypothetical protein